MVFDHIDRRRNPLGLARQPVEEAVYPLEEPSTIRQPLINQHVHFTIHLSALEVRGRNLLEENLSMNLGSSSSFSSRAEDASAQVTSVNAPKPDRLSRPRYRVTRAATRPGTRRLSRTSRPADAGTPRARRAAAGDASAARRTGSPRGRRRTRCLP